jgi:hypothetical protein
MTGLELKKNKLNKWHECKKGEKEGLSEGENQQ